MHHPLPKAKWLQVLSEILDKYYLYRNMGYIRSFNIPTVHLCFLKDSKNFRTRKFFFSFFFGRVFNQGFQLIINLKPSKSFLINWLNTCSLRNLCSGTVLVLTFEGNTNVVFITKKCTWSLVIHLDNLKISPSNGFR